MVLGRFKEAVADVTETIRRVFKDPVCRSVPSAFRSPESEVLRLLEATCAPMDFRLEASVETPDLHFQPVMEIARMSFQARPCGESAWASWAGGAKLCEMQVLRVGNCGRMSIPALPRSASARRHGFPPFRTSVLAFRHEIDAPAVRGFSPQLPPSRVHRDLSVVLGLPIAITGEDFQMLPRVLNMRYSFPLVKTTGENIRNLDVLGVFLVPVKGVSSLRHDPRTGRLLVDLGPEAVGAKRGRFILARKKDDHGFVSCFVEE